MIISVLVGMECFFIVACFLLFSLLIVETIFPRSVTAKLTALGLCSEYLDPALLVDACMYAVVRSPFVNRLFFSYMDDLGTLVKNQLI
jgi:hypothetical protein